MISLQNAMEFSSGSISPGINDNHRIDNYRVTKWLGWVDGWVHLLAEGLASSDSDLSLYEDYQWPLVNGPPGFS